MEHDKGVETTEILMTKPFFKKVLRAAQEGNERWLKRKLASQYTSQPRFDPDDIMEIDWSALPEVVQTGGSSYVAKAEVKIARGQRVLAEFVREHTEDACELGLSSDTNKITASCSVCTESVSLTRQSLRGTTIPEEEERRRLF